MIASLQSCLSRSNDVVEIHRLDSVNYKCVYFKIYLYKVMKAVVISFGVHRITSECSFLTVVRVLSEDELSDVLQCSCRQLFIIMRILVQPHGEQCNKNYAFISLKFMIRY